MGQFDGGAGYALIAGRATIAGGAVVEKLCATPCDKAMRDARTIRLLGADIEVIVVECFRSCSETRLGLLYLDPAAAAVYSSHQVVLIASTVVD